MLRTNNLVTTSYIFLDISVLLIVLHYNVQHCLILEYVVGFICIIKYTSFDLKELLLEREILVMVLTEMSTLLKEILNKYRNQ